MSHDVESKLYFQSIRVTDDFTKNIWKQEAYENNFVTKEW